MTEEEVLREVLLLLVGHGLKIERVTVEEERTVIEISFSRL